MKTAIRVLNQHLIGYSTCHWTNHGKCRKVIRPRKQKQWSHSNVYSNIFLKVKSVWSKLKKALYACITTAKELPQRKYQSLKGIRLQIKTRRCARACASHLNVLWLCRTYSIVEFIWFVRELDFLCQTICWTQPTLPLDLDSLHSVGPITKKRFVSNSRNKYTLWEEANYIASPTER